MHYKLTGLARDQRWKVAREWRGTYLWSSPQSRAERQNQDSRPDYRAGQLWKDSWSDSLPGKQCALFPCLATSSPRGSLVSVLRVRCRPGGSWAVSSSLPFGEVPLDSSQPATSNTWQGGAQGMSSMDLGSKSSAAHECWTPAQEWRDLTYRKVKMGKGEHYML